MSSGNVVRRVSNGEQALGNSDMSDLIVTKQLDGYAATFLRFEGADKFVIAVNGAERTVSREFWRTLPHRDVKQGAEIIGPP
jgi:hypothetical protein